VRSIVSSHCARLTVALLLLPPTFAAGQVEAVSAVNTPVCPASTISAGSTWSAAISNGQLYTWGRNVEGELGLGFQSTQVPTPTAVKSNPLLTSVTEVTAGFITAYAIDPSGQAWGWGIDEHSQRGNGSPLTDVYLPTPAPISGPTNVVSVGAAFDHALALTSDGTVWGWGESPGLGLDSGDNFFAQDAPVILSTPAHVVKVVAGYRFSLLLTSDGTVYSVGNNVSGQLGLPDRFVPTWEAIPGLSGIVDVAVSEGLGTGFTIALDRTGHVFVFGDNTQGQLGNGTPQFPLSTSTPTEVAGLDGVIQVAAGGSFVLALKRDGTVWAWGAASFGVLGIGPVTTGNGDVAVPTQVAFPAATEIVQVAAGFQHSLAIDSDGNVWAWGEDSLGALGTGVVGQNQLTPVEISLTTSCPGLPRPPSVPTISSLSPSFGPAEGSTQVTITGTLGPSVRASVAAARTAAQAVRPSLPTELYEQVNALHWRIQNPTWQPDLYPFLNDVQQSIRLVDGLLSAFSFEKGNGGRILGQKVVEKLGGASATGKVIIGNCFPGFPVLENRAKGVRLNGGLLLHGLRLFQSLT